MMVCESAGGPSRHGAAHGIVLVALGVGEAGASPALPPIERVAAALAERLRLEMLPLELAGPSDGSLAALTAAGAKHRNGWVAPLGVDVGRPLAEGGSWAQVLGAWRQPALLVVPAAQLTSGLPAAGTALLERWGVPLVGLVQWEGRWDATARRGDGLPWLGLLSDERAPAVGRDIDGSLPDGAEEGLETAVALRMQRLRS